MTDGQQPTPTFRLPVGVHVPARVGVPAALTLAAFLLGPRARVEEHVAPVEIPADVERYLDSEEAAVPRLRQGEGKALVWRDPASHAPTPLSVVYLHGFSADRHELDPVPERIAAGLDANLYFPRLSGHGRDGAAMAEASAGAWLADVEEALTVAGRVGERIVVIGTSTGATLAVWAALQERWTEKLAAVILVSPNFGPADRNARLLLWPWGAHIARAVVGPERCFEPANEDQARHWTTCYPVRALVPMMALVERVRTLGFTSIRVPALMLYSPTDRVVEVDEILRRFDEYGGSPKRLERVEGVGDPGSHVLAGDILSPETNDRVVRAVLDFLASVRLEGS